jgi:hypothetical protein
MDRRMGKRTGILVAAALSGVVAAGAVTASRAQREPAPAGQGAPAGVGSAVREPTAREKSRLHRAEELLLRDCMRHKGFVYRPVSDTPVPDARDFPYVIDDVSWARAHGYGTDIERKAARIRQTGVNQRYFRSLPAARRAQALRAANGVSPQGISARTPDGMVLQRSADGCRSQAERSLYGDLRTWFQATVTMESVEQMRRPRVLADPRFARAVRPWAACMAGAGLVYASPAELRAKALPAGRATPLPRQREIRLAVAEARCAISSGLAAKARYLDRGHTARLERQYRSELDTAHRLQLAALLRAGQVIRASR